MKYILKTEENLNSDIDLKSEKYENSIKDISNRIKSKNTRVI
jgi:hypothetical protein